MVGSPTSASAIRTLLRRLATDDSKMSVLVVAYRDRCRAVLVSRGISGLMQWLDERQVKGLDQFGELHSLNHEVFGWCDAVIQTAEREQRKREEEERAAQPTNQELLVERARQQAEQARAMYAHVPQSAPEPQRFPTLEERMSRAFTALLEEALAA